jgi:hypothetical protein
MIKFSNKYRLAIGTAAFGLIITTSSFISSTHAASIKNGVTCKKSGQTTKSGSKTYVCGSNPYITPSKLTWMLRQCPQTFELYTDSKDQYEIFKDILFSAGEEGKAEADKLLKGISDLETLMKTQVCKKGK